MLEHERTGSGRPLLMVHGLGASGKTWQTIMEPLAAEREVITIDLPGFGDTSPLDGKQTVSALTDSISDFLDEQDLAGVDMVGSSMGARMTLELARRGRAGAVVALDPGGFWTHREARFFEASVNPSVRLVKALQPIMPFLTSNPVTRTLLFPQFSAQPWKLDPEVTLQDMRDFASSPVILDTLHELANGPTQKGLHAGEAKAPIVIGWGKRDMVTLPRQAPRAMKLFPDAKFHWFEKCGHFPHWDQPEETVELILETTSG